MYKRQVLDKLSAIAVDKGVQPVIVCTKADLGEVEFLRSAYEKSTLPFIAIRYDSGEGPVSYTHLALCNDATRPNPKLPAADRILVDAPCSGLGILAKKPDIRYKTLEKARHDELLATQSSILDLSLIHI